MRAIDAVSRTPGEDASLEAGFVTEANHRIANNLALIGSAVKARAAEVTARDRLMRPSEVAAILDDVSARIATVGALHRLLSVTAATRTVDLAGYLDRVAETAVSALAADGRVELIWTSMGACSVPSDIALPVALVVAEVLTNSVKYAHPAGGTTRVWLACSRRADAAIMIDINDDGVGLPEGFDAYADGSVGFRTIRALAEQLGAKLLFRSGPLGLGVTLIVPGRNGVAPHFELVG